MYPQQGAQPPPPGGAHDPRRPAVFMPGAPTGTGPPPPGFGGAPPPQLPPPQLPPPQQPPPWQQRPPVGGAPYGGAPTYAPPPQARAPPPQGGPPPQGAYAQPALSAPPPAGAMQAGAPRAPGCAQLRAPGVPPTAPPMGGGGPPPAGMAMPPPHGPAMGGLPPPANAFAAGPPPQQPFRPPPAQMGAPPPGMPQPGMPPPVHLGAPPPGTGMPRRGSAPNTMAPGMVALGPPPIGPPPTGPPPTGPPTGPPTAALHAPPTGPPPPAMYQARSSGSLGPPPPAGALGTSGPPPPAPSRSTGSYMGAPIPVGGLGVSADVDQPLAERFVALPLQGHGPGGPGGALDPARLPRPTVDEARVTDRAECHPTGVAGGEQCAPRFLRLTVNAAPSSTQVLQKSGLPFGAVLQPLAPPRLPGETDVPVVAFGGGGVVRCRRCRTYINPFVGWLDAGRRWKCNLCHLANEVPPDYCAPLDDYGRRRDAAERAELSCGTVEFVASADYMVRPPQPPVYVFLLDVSYHAVSSGLLATVAQTVRETLDGLPGDVRTQVAILAYDSAVHFFHLAAHLSTPQMITVADINDIFLPLPDDLLVNLGESRALVDALLERLPAMFAPTLILDAALGPALKAAFQLMQHVGGKLALFATALPSVGEAKLRNREDMRAAGRPGTAPAKGAAGGGASGAAALLVAEEPFYKKLAVECSRQQICVDVWLFGAPYMDAATIGQLAKHTGGSLCHMPGFSAPRDGAALAEALSHNLTREQGWEAVMRVRCSQGVKITSFLGHFFVRGTDLLALPNVDADKAFTITLGLEENVLTASHIALQAALLYTTSSGERRIRVHTVSVPVIGAISQLFERADPEACATLLAKLAAERALSGRLPEARELLQSRLVDVLGGFRQVCPPDAKLSNAVLLPPSLQLLPLYVLGLIKGQAFKPDMDVRSDERSAALAELECAPVHVVVSSAHPRLMPLLIELRPPLGQPGPNGHPILPPLLPLVAERTLANAQGAFLLEDGRQLLLWIGRAAPPAFLLDVFARPSLDGLDPAALAVAPREHSVAAATVHALIAALRAERPGSLSAVRVVRQGAPEELLVTRCMFEDRSAQTMAYGEFLVHCHRAVTAKVA